jgi:hypothetical protein
VAFVTWVSDGQQRIQEHPAIRRILFDQEDLDQSLCLQRQLETSDCIPCRPSDTKIDVVKAGLYPSKSGTPVVTYVHSGGHLLPDDVPPVIVKFFKQQAKP